VKQIEKIMTIYSPRFSWGSLCETAV